MLAAFNGLAADATAAASESFADFLWSALVIAFWVVIGVAFVVFVIGFIGHTVTVAEKQKRDQEQFEEENRLRREHLDLEKKERAETLRMMKEQAACEQEKQLHEQALARREQMKVTASTPEDLDEFIKNACLFRQPLGRVLTVAIYAVPTGRILIRWIVERPPPSPYYVAVIEDRVTIQSEYANEGEIVRQLQPGFDYRYQFEVIEGNRDLEKPPFYVTVNIPKPAVWNRTVADVVAKPKPPKEKKPLAEIFKARAQRQIQQRRDIETLLGEFREERLKEENARDPNPAHQEIISSIIEGEVLELKRELESLLERMKKKKNR